MLKARAVHAAGTWDLSHEAGIVTLDYDGRHRRRLSLATDAGEAFLLDLHEARHLRDSDGLALDDGRVVRVVAKPEPVSIVTAADPFLLLRCVWHLGNRHLPASLSGGRILIRPDHVITAMLRGLGATVEHAELRSIPSRAPTRRRRAAMPITTILSTDAALLRLLTWFSPAFPTGAFAHSHGIESAVEDGLVTDEAASLAWIDAVIRDGAPRLDAVLLRHAHAATDAAALGDLARLAEACAPSREMREETRSQGIAFVAAARAWGAPLLDAVAAAGIAVPHPVAAGVLARAWDRRGGRRARLRARLRRQPGVGRPPPRAARPDRRTPGPARARTRDRGDGGRDARVGPRRARHFRPALRCRIHAPRDPAREAVPHMSHANEDPPCRGHHGPLPVGIGGPVGTGKTALMERLCRRFRDELNIAAITNDISTREDAEFLTRAGALAPERILGIETGGCPHTAIREDASINLAGVAKLNRDFPGLDLILIESGGDNLAATFSPDLADITIYVIDVSGGDKIPRKGGPGITRSDLLVINKTDLAPHVGASLAIMDRDSRAMRGERPFVFCNLKAGDGVEAVASFIRTAGGLAAVAASPA